MTLDFLKENQSPYCRCNGAFKVGVCYWMLGGKEKTSEWLLKCEEWVKKGYEHDEHASRLAKVSLNTFFLFSKIFFFYLSRNFGIIITHFPNLMSCIFNYKTLSHPKCGKMLNLLQYNYKISQLTQLILDQNQKMRFFFPESFSFV